MYEVGQRTLQDRLAVYVFHYIPRIAFLYRCYGYGRQFWHYADERYGITDSSSVEEQLWAGARYIASLYRIFENKVDSTEIYYFVAGAYNSGPGHILDAMALCKKHDGDYQHWQPVSEYLILKSRREYYNDPVVKCGYYPGKHTVNYVEEVMNRYNGYVITKKEE